MTLRMRIAAAVAASGLWVDAGEFSLVESGLAAWRCVRIAPPARCAAAPH